MLVLAHICAHAKLRHAVLCGCRCRLQGETWPAVLRGHELDPMAQQQDQQRLMLERFQREVRTAVMAITAIVASLANGGWWLCAAQRVCQPNRVLFAAGGRLHSVVGACVSHWAWSSRSAVSAFKATSGMTTPVVRCPCGDVCCSTLALTFQGRRSTAWPQTQQPLWAASQQTPSWIEVQPCGTAGWWHRGGLAPVCMYACWDPLGPDCRCFRQLSQTSTLTCLTGLSRERSKETCNQREKRSCYCVSGTEEGYRCTITHAC